MKGSGNNFITLNGGIIGSVDGVICIWLWVYYIEYRLLFILFDSIRFDMTWQLRKQI